LIQEYDPTHPDANDKGLVTWPNVNPVTEMVSLMLASRAFDANVAAFRAGKNMALKALEIGR
jgi:flagellar basal-body rod protein FlgC